MTSGEIPPTLADHHKSTLIHKAALNGHLRCLSFLVKNSPRDAINLLDDNLLTPVLLAIQVSQMPQVSSQGSGDLCRVAILIVSDGWWMKQM